MVNPDTDVVPEEEDNETAESTSEDASTVGELVSRKDSGGGGGGPPVAGGPRRTRLISESSNDGLEGMMPLELDDLISYQNKDANRINESDDGPIMVAAVNPLFSLTMLLKRKISNDAMGGQTAEVAGRARRNWKSALRGMSEREDPWAEILWDEIPMEKATRYRYNPMTKKWHEEMVVVKFDDEVFGKGAMRECYRMKKLSNFSQNLDWNRDSNNYVAKAFMEEVPRETYFSDVKLQMDAKLWGEEFNRHNPPKKVDIFMMAVLEFHERPSKPLFHVEHFIEGDYIKYNSNSGFVEEGMSRQTPHAFSHFSFERSGHELMIVDVQGVGDLYTDPQIHTADGIGYGDGNLGTKGMALFFHSHICNDICKNMGLSVFDLSETERKAQVGARLMRLPSKTVIRGQEMVPCESPSDSIKARARSNSNANSVDIAAAQLEAQKGRRQRTFSDYYSMEEPILEDQILDTAADSACKSDSARSGDSSLSLSAKKGARERRLTDSSDDSGIVSSKSDFLSFQEVLQNKAKPSNLKAMDKDSNSLHDDSILGNVHLDLCKYHEMCRFTDDGTSDKSAALFHLKCAAECGVIPAIVNLAKMYFGMPHDILPEMTVDDDEEERGSDEVARGKIGYRYMEDAARAGHRDSMVFVARALDTGHNLDDPAKKSAKAAIDWYEKICEKDEEEAADNTEWGLDDAPYLLMARQAELWLEGEEGAFEKDPTRAGDLYNQAAESAMACMKGKMANKYYMMAEEAYGQCEE